MDFYQKFWRPDAGQGHLIAIGRIAGGILLILGTLWAPVVQTFPTIFDYFQQCWAIMAIPFAVIFLAGVTWKRANNIAATSTMILGMIAIPITFWLRSSVFADGFSFYNLVGIVGLFLLCWMVAISLLTTPQAQEKITAFIWSRRLIRLPPGETPLPYSRYKNDLLWWGIITVLTVLLYIIFW
jgi:SSS family solute:Na+ symporter